MRTFGRSAVSIGMRAATPSAWPVLTHTTCGPEPLTLPRVYGMFMSIHSGSGWDPARAALARTARACPGVRGRRISAWFAQSKVVTKWANT
jgi:hypothetical protein